MKTLTAIMLLLASTSLLSQSTHINPAGALALDFSIDGVSLGGGLGGRYWITNDLSLRASVTFSTSEETREYLNSTLGPYTDEEQRNAIGLNLSGVIVILRRESFGVYTGIEVQGLSTKRTYKATYAPDSYGEDGFRTYSIRPLIGIDCHLTDDISLSGEHNVAYGWSSGEGTNPTKRSGTFFQNGNSRLTVSFLL